MFSFNTYLYDSIHKFHINAYPIIMKHLKCYTIIGIIFVAVTGSLSHFLYNWSGNNYIVGLFAPINESIWEHMKLLFFPMLLYSLLLIFKFGKTYPHITSSLFFGLSIGTMLIPIFFYAYTFLLGRDIFVLDIGIFILSILIAFWLSYKLTLSHKLDSCKPFLCCLVCILLVCFVWFTYHPPAAEIFADPEMPPQLPGQNACRLPPG